MGIVDIITCIFATVLYVLFDFTTISIGGYLCG